MFKKSVASHSKINPELEALSRSQAVIYFETDGTIIRANDNFLDVTGYTLAEIQGEHHSIFVEAEHRVSPEYVKFWDTLRRGQFQADQYKCFAKGGKEVWLEATYNPILDNRGNVVQVVKYAADITAQKIQSDDLEKQMDAIVESAKSNAKSIAMVVEGMSSSIEEISKNMNLSSDAAHNILGSAGETRGAVEKLIQGLKSIDNMVEQMSDIAEKVSLLALNATIEAAHVGEEGKGFAVVASEMKSLAKKAANAAEEFSLELSDVHALSKTTFEHVQDIEKSARNVSESVNGTSNAVEKQSTVTSKVSMDVKTVTTSVADLANRIRTLCEAA